MTFELTSDSAAAWVNIHGLNPEGVPLSVSQLAGGVSAEEWLTRPKRRHPHRSGDAYKPAAIRPYRHALDCRILPHFGHKRLSDLSAIMLQDFIDGLLAAGRSPSTIRNALLPLRAIYRRAHKRGEVADNPTLKLALPAVRSSRDRVARADEAAALLAALPSIERGLWATGF